MTTARTPSETPRPERTAGVGTSRRGLTAVELLILAGLLVLLAMVVVPRLNAGADAERHAELIGRLATLRNAIDLYAAEHRGRFPSVERFEQQLTRPTTIEGEVLAEGKDQGEANGEGEGDGTGEASEGDYVYGPYLEEIPALPIGKYKGRTGVVNGSIRLPGKEAGGWLYNPNNGEIRANLPERATDPRGTPYNRY